VSASKQASTAGTTASALTARILRFVQFRPNIQSTIAVHQLLQSLPQKVCLHAYPGLSCNKQMPLLMPCCCATHLSQSLAQFNVALSVQTAHWVCESSHFSQPLMCHLKHVRGCRTGVRCPGSSSLDRIPASGHGFPPPPAPPPPLSRPKQASTLGATPLPPQAAAPSLARHSCQQQATSACHTRNGLAQYAPRPPIPHAPQSGTRYFMLNGFFSVDFTDKRLHLQCC